MKVLIALAIAFSCITSHVHAQDQLNLYVVPFRNDTELNTIFAHSDSVLQNLPEADSEMNVALVLSTSSQESELKAKGVRPEIIEESVNLAEYVYLYHPEEGKAPELAALGKVYAISSHYTLVHLYDPDSFTYEGAMTQFSLVPLGMPVENPISTPAELPPPLVIEQDTDAQQPWLKFWPAAVIILVIGAGAGGYVLYRRRSNRQDPIPEDLSSQR